MGHRSELAHAVTVQFAGISSAYPAARHAASPPSSGWTRVTPYFISASAARALEASLGHVQKRTISRSRGSSFLRASISSNAKWKAPGRVSCSADRSSG